MDDRAWVEVDLGAIAHNVTVLRRVSAPSALWVVVKANGYGHGAVEVGRTALAAGAGSLCVATVDEGVELRAAGIDAPVLVLSEPAPRRFADAAAARLAVAVYSDQGIDAAIQASAGGSLAVHLKVDTGMHRVGADPSDAVRLAARIVAAPSLRLQAVWTHLAVADSPDDPYTAVQLASFDATLADLATAGVAVPAVHIANSAGALAHPAARRDAVRVGIAVYGIAPSAALGQQCRDLTPALSVRSLVAHVQHRRAGDRISYGLRHRFTADTTVATVPVGYADGVPRRLSAAGGCVLIGGRHRPMVGVITMDQLMVDCGDDDITRGDEVVLIGSQGDATITADDWAARLDTISYEIVTGLGPRLPRLHRPIGG
jgi:alanine racemase